MDRWSQNRDNGRSYYDILGVSPTAVTEEIKVAYREKLLSIHPDKSGKHDDQNQVVIVKEAHRVLLDTKLRQIYDKNLASSVKGQGFILSGDGLDLYNLNDFTVEENNESLIWYKDCPRCQKRRGMMLSENDLQINGTENGIGGYQIVVQCDSCSLWISVEYYEESESE
ncbi:uncharacterized protein PRCAT00005962001 [Priceomyces carsonii]|uniref:uncharacterized protein n=1 Tax=Priceomyces carsonii TaxID=28549 RepID=UPI002ED88004|nr:unnamed protein product [Priceomyces carsonii]